MGNGKERWEREEQNGIEGRKKEGN